MTSTGALTRGPMLPTCVSAAVRPRPRTVHAAGDYELSAVVAEVGGSRQVQRDVCVIGLKGGTLIRRPRLAHNSCKQTGVAPSGRPLCKVTKTTI